VKAKYGIIGGSGLYQLPGARVIDVIDIPTPFGMPSDIITIADIGGINTAFLPRHGVGHRILPTEVPSKANIWALKSLGVEHILSISAVGSLIEAYKPGDFVVCDQLIDRTRSRDNSYFGNGIVGHVSFAEPFCHASNQVIINTLAAAGVTFHKSGTVVTMEGPLFSTKAESLMYRSWNAHLIGMTALPEAKLAREAEICYSLVAMVTDYDCWRESEEVVTLEMVLETMDKNVGTIRGQIPALIQALEQRSPCACSKAAQFAFMTDKSKMPAQSKRLLNLFYKKYWD